MPLTVLHWWKIKVLSVLTCLSLSLFWRQLTPAWGSIVLLWECAEQLISCSSLVWRHTLVKHVMKWIQFKMQKSKTFSQTSLQIFAHIHPTEHRKCYWKFHAWSVLFLFHEVCTMYCIRRSRISCIFLLDTNHNISILILPIWTTMLDMRVL